jgi:hypothetical protein
MRVMRVNTKLPNYPRLEFELAELVATAGTHRDEQRDLGGGKNGFQFSVSALYATHSRSLTPERSSSLVDDDARKLARCLVSVVPAIRRTPVDRAANKSATRPFRDRSCAT